MAWNPFGIFILGLTYKKLQQKSEAKAAYKNARRLYQSMGLNEYIELCDQGIANLEEREKYQFNNDKTFSQMPVFTKVFLKLFCG